MLFCILTSSVWEKLIFIRSNWSVWLSDVFLHLCFLVLVPFFFSTPPGGSTSRLLVFFFFTLWIFDRSQNSKSKIRNGFNHDNEPRAFPANHSFAWERKTEKFLLLSKFKFSKFDKMGCKIFWSEGIKNFQKYVFPASIYPKFRMVDEISQDPFQGSRNCHKVIQKPSKVVK